MDRMKQEIAGEFREIDNATRTVLAFLKESHQSAGLALLNRYAARHDREWHRAIDKLRVIQKEKRRQSAAPTDHCISPNEPNTDPTPESSTVPDSELATSPEPLATETSPNEPEPTLTPGVFNNVRLPTGHWPQATGH
jgi:hypothetical protein